MFTLVLIFQIRKEESSTKSKALEIRNQVITYASQKQLSVYMKKKILAYYGYRYQNNYFREKDIFSKFTGMKIN